MSDEEVVRMILDKTPAWANGALVAPLGLEFLPSVRPVKKSMFGDNEYYTSKMWRPIDAPGLTVHPTDYHEVVLFYNEHGKVVITKDGRIVKVAKITEGRAPLRYNIYVA